LWTGKILPREEGLGKEIWKQGAGWNLTLFEPYFHGVKAIMDIIPREQLKITACGMPKRLFLAGIDRLRWPAEKLAGPGADLHENEDLAATTDQVDLAARRQVIAGQHPVTMPTQENGSHALTIVPDLRRSRQPRRRRAPGSA
jgi:hypothetical protein